jgi:hypothetical protein
MNDIEVVAYLVVYMKIPPSPLYQRGVRGDFHTSLWQQAMGLPEQIVGFRSGIVLDSTLSVKNTRMVLKDDFRSLKNRHKIKVRRFCKPPDLIWNSLIHRNRQKSSFPWVRNERPKKIHQKSVKDYFSADQSRGNLTPWAFRLSI